MTREGWHDDLDGLLTTAGLTGPYDISPITHRGNNRVFRLDLSSGAFLLKQYFRHASDSRDRLGSEFGFVSCAWNHGLRTVPKPLASNPEAGLGLYEFLDGRKVTGADVNADAVEQAARFFCGINEHRFASDAQVLGSASEACFSLREHVALVDRRVAKLCSLRIRDETDLLALEFVRGDLRPRWWSVREAIKACGIDGDAVLAGADRCLSPSDFGFHNALLGRDGVFRFIDFEYAGWDDPAKMICDFFCQPQAPVAKGFFESFAARTSAVCADASRCIDRARALLPVYQIKWCCILLNEFLPTGRDRRAFATASEEGEEHRRKQLKKARIALGCVMAVA